MPTKRGNNEGSITKRSGGLWKARITLDHGKRTSFYGKTRQEAARKLTAALRDRDAGLPVVAGAQTVGHYMSHWLEAAKPTVRERTWRGYEVYVRRHAFPMLGAIPLVKLTPQHLQLLYAKKLEEGLTSTSVHHLHAVLHQALDAALRLGLVQRNVCEMVDVPRMRHHEITTLTEAQAQTLLATSQGDRLEALYVLALATGMRQGELLDLIRKHRLCEILRRVMPHANRGEKRDGPNEAVGVERRGLGAGAPAAARAQAASAGWATAAR